MLAGGPFDRGSADLANGPLVGNGSDCAVLELTMRGGALQRGDLGIALAGAPIEASIVGTGGNPRRFRVPSSGSLHAGERLVLGGLHRKGGAHLFVGGQRFPDTRADGQPFVRAAAVPRRFSNALVRTLPTRHLGEPLWSNPAVQPFRIIGGPEAHFLITPDFWMQSRFRVGSRSNRMGLCGWRARRSS